MAHWRYHCRIGRAPLATTTNTPRRKHRLGAIGNEYRVSLIGDARYGAEEVRRLLDLGARHADVGQGDASWVVLADPEGNEFCVLADRSP